MNITEHNASSYYDDFDRKSRLKNNHYVTGFGKRRSGLMVKDLSHNPIKALMSITDRNYLSKLGLSKEDLTIEKAEDFLNKNLIVPIYIGSGIHQEYLPIIVNLISYSKFVKSYEKIIFHINARSFNRKLFKSQQKRLEQHFPSLKMNMIPEISTIVGHYFETKEDLTRLYQLYSNRGIAVCSSDKVLELAISTGLLPLYLPLIWKNNVAESFIKYVGRNSNYGTLLKYLRGDRETLIAGFYSGKATCSPDYQEYYTKVTAKFPDIFPIPTRLLAVTELLSKKLGENYLEEIRPSLLQDSFWNVLESKILPQLY